MKPIDPTALTRLLTARNLWLATVRPNGSPHPVPIWFVWHQDHAYICTSDSSVKARNIAHNSNIAFALEDGDDPLVIEGTANRMDKGSIPPEIVLAFQQKFDWNIQGDSTYNVVIEITPSRILL